MNQNNTEILSKAKNGHPRAQMAVYEQYYKAVFNSCFRILQNKEDAEDITHDTFIVAFNKNTIVPNNIEIIAWYRKIGINKSIDFLRKKQKTIIKDNYSEDIEEENTEDNYSEFDAKNILVYFSL